VAAARPLVLLLVSCTLMACTTQTIDAGASRTVRTSVGPAQSTSAVQSLHGYVEGELLLSFTAEGERTIAAAVGQPPNRLRFGVPSLDRLNAKYRASQLVKVIDLPDSYILRIASDANVFRAVDEYGKEPLISAADLHYLYRLPPPQAPDAVRTKVGPLKPGDRSIPAPIPPPAR
jgi:hypothetical protein